MIGGANGRVRREVATLQPVSQQRFRRAVVPSAPVDDNEYLKTLFASHSAQNGTNMHFLSLGKNKKVISFAKLFSDEVQQSTMGIISGVIGTILFVVVGVLIAYRNRIECTAASSDDRLNNELTTEEEALLAKKLGNTSYKPNNLVKQNNYGYNNQAKILNNQVYQKGSNTRDDLIIKNHIKPPKRNYSSNQHVKIHNNLHKTGTEIWAQ